MSTLRIGLKGNRVLCDSRGGKMRYAVIFFAVALLSPISAFGKIRSFLNQEALIFMLNSEELTELRVKEPLKGTDLVRTEINRNDKNNGSIGTIFKITLYYEDVPVGYKSCKLV